MKSTFLYFFTLIILFSACTIQKRTVNKGYFVQWHWQKFKAGKAQTAMDESFDQQEANLKPENGAEENTPVFAEAEPANESEINVMEQASVQDHFLAEAPEKPALFTQHTGKKLHRIPEGRNKIKTFKHKAETNILDDFAIVYVIIAGILLLLAVLFLVIGLNVAIIADTIFFVLSIVCFIGAIVVLAFALLLLLFSNRLFRSRKKNKSS